MKTAPVIAHNRLFKIILHFAGTHQAAQEVQSFAARPEFKRAINGMLDTEYVTDPQNIQVERVDVIDNTVIELSFMAAPLWKRIQICAATLWYSVKLDWKRTFDK